MQVTMVYTGCALDRSARRRRDAAWVTRRLEDPSTRIVPVCRDRNLVVIGDSPSPVTVPAGDIGTLLAAASEVVFLGVGEGGQAWFTADFPAEYEERVVQIHPEARFTELRQVGPLIGQADGALLAYARAMAYWHRRHRFCGLCGAPTESREGGSMRACTARSCGELQFPRTDPAVIMLVSGEVAGDSVCLLARHERWPAGFMSTLAGFVEPGESLEEAVVREVAEETGLVVTDVRYRGSQPWPFPSSLMLGFRARAEASAELDFDRHELEDARWFTAAEIRAHRQHGIKLPRADSIARRLIQEWLAEQGRSREGLAPALTPVPASERHRA